MLDVPGCNRPIWQNANASGGLRAEPLIHSYASSRYPGHTIGRYILANKKQVLVQGITSYKLALFQFRKINEVLQHGYIHLRHYTFYIIMTEDIRLAGKRCKRTTAAQVYIYINM